MWGGSPRRTGPARYDPPCLFPLLIPPGDAGAPGASDRGRNEPKQARVLVFGVGGGENFSIRPVGRGQERFTSILYVEIGSYLPKLRGSGCVEIAADRILFVAAATEAAIAKSEIAARSASRISAGRMVQSLAVSPVVGNPQNAWASLGRTAPGPGFTIQWTSRRSTSRSRRAD